MSDEKVYSQQIQCLDCNQRFTASAKVSEGVKIVRCPFCNTPVSVHAVVRE